MMVMVCIRYTERGGGSAMLTKLLDFAVEPQRGDLIEVLPERGGPGEDRHVSSWHEAVVDRFVHCSVPEYALEVHVSPPQLHGSRVTERFSAEERAERQAEISAVLVELQEAGWS